MRAILVSVIVAAALVVSAQLVADENNELFTRIDANQDGFVTEGEVNPEHKVHFERMLRDCDADKDRKLTKKEFLAPLAASTTKEQERARIASIIKLAEELEGSKMP